MGGPAVQDPGTRETTRPGRAALVRLVIVVAVLGVAGAGAWLIARAGTPEASPTTTDIPALQVEPADVEPGSVIPAADTIAGAETGAGQVRPRPQAGADPLREWAERTSAAVGVPARALRAYGNAELAMRAHQPDCRISWATLAGIGRIESDHGQYRDAVLGDDGRPSTPIIGVPLNGSPGVRAIPDTDGGALDGDPVHDRAVGPMQFIPSTWERWASDGDGDGLADPQQIDDAALTAARYLCAGGRDMASAEGWWAGIMSYNNSVEYAQKVFGLADTYARQAQTAQG
ncbi:lytic transglycosylase domain-containing protein [Prauserella flavalba]|uniref:lytic transglycosylase domain-containing protein n=1 Tax=Prauserella flavalba TaxID=1477506 RepID=UPI0036E32DD2